MDCHWLGNRARVVMGSPPPIMMPQFDLILWMELAQQFQLIDHHDQMWRTFRFTRLIRVGVVKQFPDSISSLECGDLS